MNRPRAGAETVTGIEPRDLPTGTGLLGLPGVAIPGRMPGQLPRELLAPGSLLLAGAAPGRPVSWAEHLLLWGAHPRMEIDRLVELVAAQGVVGAGGAGFPTDRKLASLIGARVSHVIINGAEGEAASGKDGVLLGHVPHLVLDGAVAAARALGAPRVVIRISADRRDLAGSLPRAVAARDEQVPIEVSMGPASFVAGEASAVIRAVSGGPALPDDLGRPPALPRRLGRGRTRVLLSNTETFARIALAAREIGSQSALASISGAVGRPGVVELPESATLAELVDVGGLVGSPRVLITGGWHGRWVRWDWLSASTGMTRASVATLGGRWGAGAFVWLPEDLNAWDAVAGITRELADGSARQCGPCWRGLPALAELIERDAGGGADRAEIEGLMRQVDGRGICAHPSAAVAAVRSALDLIGADR